MNKYRTRAYKNREEGESLGTKASKLVLLVCMNKCIAMNADMPFSGGNNNFVMMADPNQLENILRAEGKYPNRDSNFTPTLEWFQTKSKYPVAFGAK